MADAQMPDPVLQSALDICEAAQTEIVQSNKRLADAATNTINSGVPHEIAVSPAHGQFLALLCRAINAKNVLEIGVLGGFSTIWFAESLPGIHVTGIEYDAKHHKVATENTKGLGNVELLLGAALDVLPRLAEQNRVFDFVFIDAAWEEQAQYFDWAVKMTRKGGIIYVDNSVRQLTESSEEERRPGAPAVALIEHVKADKRVTATLIPTLNTHKKELLEVVDGFLFAVVQ
ncbi:S-adenosyl-L-methionine-dependent methyltransferase [Neohortaea acidophila]|uniref:S-adenosyl-L-methionine-dependent methyltransferase n=1 Tax=Neohortaea acidophila TaxID=245834 RepID=A0A6A6Q5G3_9PEZI|nr:S-adenosyl-L-methionine-dependent methyltransferase [Neohortaea acidophila]KAF2487532.1 S-adenosyl-L-methionine-dependent methyltransferase [Neohortaea acidophila]